MQQSEFERKLVERLEPEIESLGFECVELTFAVEAGRRLLRLVLDGPHGVTLDECARVSRTVGPLLEEMPEVPQHFVLEVSSPGINRPLTKPAHFERFAGERVKIRLRAKIDGGATVTGTIGPLRDGILTVLTTVGPKDVPLDAIARARLHRDLDAILKADSARLGATATGDAGHNAGDDAGDDLRR